MKKGDDYCPLFFKDVAKINIMVDNYNTACSTKTDSSDQTSIPQEKITFSMTLVKY
ncbi:hypothetical protein SAMN05421747_11631 [Parapedobacter composti]|uniref:Uncharacterized protein n=1 Tax=Parapedobacter composti TaxID=623281 RepID=A0A1I1KJ61_9SPHI|nr:hypothetical protein SAMN05421747_11631 [Parapedobacter composti]